MIVFLLGLVDGMEVKDFVKLLYYTANILMGEATVLHCHNPESVKLNCFER